MSGRRRIGELVSLDFRVQNACSWLASQVILFGSLFLVLSLRELQWQRNLE